MKSDKLYSSSPTIKRGSDDKVGVSKPTKADAENMAVSGNPLPGGQDGEMPLHIKQFVDMHDRHEQEMKDMHKRHQKEHEMLSKDHSGLGDAGAEVAARGAAEGEGN